MYMTKLEHGGGALLAEVGLTDAQLPVWIVENEAAAVGNWGMVWLLNVRRR
jgi:hypothetical protein